MTVANGMGLRNMYNGTESTFSKMIDWSLIFIIAVVPLIINPGAFDVWYRPKIESVYALVIIAGSAWLLKSIFGNAPLPRQGNPLTVPLLCYLGAASLSTLFSIHRALSFAGDPLRLEGFLTVLTYVALVFLFASHVKTKTLENKLVVGLIACATLVSIYAVAQYFGYNPTEHFFYRYWRRGAGVGSTMGNQNFLGKYLVLIIPIVFSLCLYRLSPPKKIIAVMSLVICFTALIVTYTRASWLSIVIGLMIFLYAASRHSLLADKARPLTACLLMLVISVVVFNLYMPRIIANQSSSLNKREPGGVVKRTVSGFHFKEGRGVATRFYVWDKATHLIMERPWFGYGLETFQIKFRPYNQDYSKRFNDFTFVDRIHNNYLDTAFSLGLTGLSAYIAIIVLFLRFLWQIINEVRDRSRKLFYIGILSGFCCYLINDIFIFSVVSVSPTFWSLMGLTIASGQLERAAQQNGCP